MKRVVLLAGVLAVAGGVFYARGGDSKAETKPSNSNKQPATHAAPRTADMSATPQVGTTNPAVKPAAVERPNTDGLPEVMEAGYLAVEHAAKTCRTGRPAPTPIRPNGPDETIESIQLAYRQVSTNGVGRVEDVKVVHGKLTDQALESCIINAAAAVTWSSSAPDGLIGTLEQNINVGDLMRPDFGLPPESKRSPKPTAPPPPELAAPLGQQAPE